MSIKYGYTIEWTNPDWSRESVSVGECETAKEAFCKTLEWAKKRGWRQKKWWQWWRWRDRRVNLNPDFSK